MRVSFACVVLVSCMSAPLVAQSTVWLGNSTNWYDPANWSAGVPTASVDATIQGGTFDPTISGAATCKTLVVGSITTAKALTIAAGGRLDVRGSAATGPGSGVMGPGLLRLAGSTNAVVSGLFAEVEVVASTVTLVAGTTLSGTLTVTNGICTVEGSTRVAALTVASLGTVNVPASVTAPFIVDGNLRVLADTSGTGSLANASTTQPVVLRGTTHAVDGSVSGRTRFEPAADSRLSVSGTISGSTEVTSLGPKFVIFGVGSSGNVTGTIVGRGGELTLQSLRCGNLDLATLTIRILGTVVCGTMDLQHQVRLAGGPSDVLRADSVIARSSSQCDGVEVPGQIHIRRGITIRPSNTFAPTRSVVRFEEPLDNPAVPIVVALSDNPPTYLGDVILANGVQVDFQCDHYTQPQGYPSIDRLVVGTGCTARAYDFRIYSADVAAGAAFEMHDWVMPGLMARTVLGQATIRGSARIHAHVALGDATHSGDVLVDVGGTLDVVPTQALDTELTIDRSLELRSGATLNLVQQGPFLTSLAVTATGRLELDGTPASPAVITGSNSPMQIDGEVFARGFRIQGMSAQGVRIGSGARFGSPPDDRNFQGGHFTRGQAGGVLLDLTRSTATTLFDLDFDDTASVRNIRTTSGSAITVVDSRGNRAGAAFEDDPGSRIAWRGNATSIANFTVRPAVHRNLLSVRTGVEETAAFRVVRLPSTGFVPFAATGPGFYYPVDDGLLAGTPYSYGLDRQRQSPFLEWVRIAQTGTSATPHAANEGVTRFVGPNGYANIAAALSGAPAGTIVAVEAGSYGGFTVTNAVRIIGEGSVALVTVTGPIVVQNVAGADVALTNLTAQASLTVNNVTAPLLLRDLYVTSGTQPALALTGCPKVAMERVSCPGTTRITAGTTYAWNCSFNSVALAQSSRLVYAGGSAVSVVPDGTSSAQRLTGAAPGLLASTTQWPSGGSRTVTVTGTAGHAAVLLLSDGLDLLDVSAFLPFDMALLLPLPRAYVLWSGAIGASGLTSVSVPGAPPSVAGYGLVLQALTLDTSFLQGRLGEALPYVSLR